MKIIDRKDSPAFYVGFCKDFSLMCQCVRLEVMMWDEDPNSDIDERRKAGRPWSG